MTPDSVNHKPNLAEIYVLADANFTGRVTVPVLGQSALHHRQ